MERKFDESLKQKLEHDKQINSKFEEIKKLLENLSLSHTDSGILKNGQI